MKDKGRSSSGLELIECNLFNYLQKMQNHSMQEVVLLGFEYVLIITAVFTGNFARAILSFKFHFMLILC